MFTLPFSYLYGWWPSLFPCPLSRNYFHCSILLYLYILTILVFRRPWSLLKASFYGFCPFILSLNLLLKTFMGLRLDFWCGSCPGLWSFLFLSMFPWQLSSDRVYWLSDSPYDWGFWWIQHSIGGLLMIYWWLYPSIYTLLDTSFKGVISIPYVFNLEPYALQNLDIPFSGPSVLDADTNSMIQRVSFLG